MIQQIIRERIYDDSWNAKCTPSFHQCLTYLLAFLIYMNSNVMEGSFDPNKILSNASQSKYSKSQGSSFADITDPKKRYAAVIQQEKQHERNQLHQRLQKQKQEEEKHYKKHLKAQIIKRKKELEFLERQKESGIEEQKKADHQAQLKKERDAIKRMEENIRAKTADQKSRLRYKEAKERQKDISKQLNKKQTRAQYLRRAHLRTENAERLQAVNFNQSLIMRQAKVKEKRLELEKTEIEEYKRGLSLHGFNQKLLNNSQPVTLVFRENEEDGQAMTKAQKQELRNSEKQKLREETELRNRKTAEERGNQVFCKMQRQREYEAYCKEAEEEQRRYNLRRLQAGKKNQFAGVKPMTLSQINLNKKIKSQVQFEQMFIKDKKASSNSNAVSKYTLVENKMKDVVVPSKTSEKWVKRPINYAENQSLIPGVSEGHYSFESEHSQQQKSAHSDIKQTKKEANVKPIIKETGTEKQAVDSVGKTRLKETRLSNEALRQELNYSDSEEDSNI